MLYLDVHLKFLFQINISRFTYLNDKPSDNAPDNTNSNVNSNVQDQTKFRENVSQVATIYQNGQKGWYPEVIKFYDQLISGIISP